ncbi:Peptidoglycan-binding Lysin subgroup [Penicillium concentricum]|uniref:Peptidoglycan-binding Lysin subgroup n=1 Tax=Penicillium concentricum TaxID=293559 RepID=A0A9W9S6G9_9EURO|nr:Peptidoglycan-binding Lysin subgroup [Penicillium concentricum]KAJ5372770.1 Peptidoglycan-binding Lysin subgroup [Penicillium concentricum]
MKPVATGYTCPSIIVGTQDTCDSLAVKCGISAASFASLNPKIACSSLAKEKPVCCELGDPAYPPKAGTAWCYTHTVRSGETCAKISEAYKITEANIETWNANTTAWYGCKDLRDGGQICLDKGEPPMPVAIGDAICGPQVPGTGRPKMSFMIPTLNPCPAGQCCSKKGQCGTGADFCGSGALAIPAGALNKDATGPANKVSSESSTKDASDAAEKQASEAAKKDASKAKIVFASEATSAKTTSATKATSTAASSTTSKATSGGTIVSLVAKSLSTSTENKDPHFFTTDIPLIDVPLTYLHPTTTVPAKEAMKVVAHLLTVGKNATAANAMSTATTEATSTTTTKATSTTSISTTKVTSVTTSKETTKTQVRITKTVKGIATVPSGWELRMWDEPGCKGSYVVLQGHNAKLEDSDCMKFGYKSELSTNVDDESVSCRYWIMPEKGNWQWKDCHGTNLNKPKSWRMSNGLCTVSPNTECDLWNDISQTYGWRGPGQCQDRQQMDPETFGSFKCYVG